MSIFSDIRNLFKKKDKISVPIENQFYNIIISFSKDDVTQCEVTVDPELNDIYKCYPDTDIKIESIFENTDLAIEKIIITTKSKQIKKN